MEGEGTYPGGGQVYKQSENFMKKLFPFLGLSSFKYTEWIHLVNLFTVGEHASLMKQNIDITGMKHQYQCNFVLFAALE